jgi:hypothetical protein
MAGFCRSACLPSAVAGLPDEACLTENSTRGVVSAYLQVLQKDRLTA